DVSLTIVGLGNFEAKLKKLCTKYGLDSMVSFYGYCPNEKLSSIYQDHDVFILPSLAESFGIVFLEAMACGLPVIGGLTGGIPAIISEENGILVEPWEVDEIKKSILIMKDQPAVRKEMEGNNRKKVLEHYSWHKVAEMYQNTYRGKAPGIA
ncbi:MAG: glycosyltransferase family 4 protein, partial [Desulfobacteraceae bacterium]|nr:glycosyltransferase family 4 protein [Desulfobacteraceae bacterium]